MYRVDLTLIVYYLLQFIGTHIDYLLMDVSTYIYVPFLLLFYSI